MTVMLGLFLWIFHGLLLWWNWGQFRPRITLLHGLLLALITGALLWLGAPAWLMYGAGAAIGAVAGWGHRLAPGLWVGLGLTWPLLFLVASAAAVPAAGAFALAAQIAAFLVAFSKSSL
jgi:O-antigen/teichoic acid export membrane protein